MIRIMDAMAALAHAVHRLQRDRDVSTALGYVLTPLRRYDRRHNGDLVRTLLAYLEVGGSVAGTADRLFLHRNSVLYRLQRIEEVSGLDLRQPGLRRLLLVAIAIAQPDETLPGEWGNAD